MLGRLDSRTICDPRSSYWRKDAAMTDCSPVTETPMSSRRRAGLAEAPLRSGIRSAGRSGSKLPEWDRAPRTWLLRGCHGLLRRLGVVCRPVRLSRYMAAPAVAEAEAAMITRHFTLAAGAKPTGPSTPLWSSVVAKMLLVSTPAVSGKYADPQHAGRRRLKHPSHPGKEEPRPGLPVRCGGLGRRPRRLDRRQHRPAGGGSVADRGTLRPGGVGVRPDPGRRRHTGRARTDPENRWQAPSAARARQGVPASPRRYPGPVTRRHPPPITHQPTNPPTQRRKRR